MPAALALWLLVIALVLARAVLGLLPSMWGWGLDVQRFLDPLAGWGAWSVAAVALLPPIARRLVAALEAAGTFLARSPRAYWAAWLGGALLAFVMPDRVWFLGDFLIRQGNVESGAFAGNYVGAMPLDYLLHSTLLHPLGFGSAEAANLAARALGAIEAGFLAVLSVRFSRALGAAGPLAPLAAGIVLFGGYLTMFTGLGKPASEMCLVTLGLATFGVDALRNRASLLPLALLMAVGFWLHRSSVMLVPAWVLVTVRWLRGRPPAQRWRQPRTWLALLVPAFSGALALPQIYAIATGYDLSHHFLASTVVQQGGMFAAAFSPRHLLDLLDLAFALSPLAIAVPVLFALRWRAIRRRPETPFLSTLAASFLPALLLVQPQQGIFRDWDVFAAAGIALSALAAFLVVEVLEAAPDRRWLAVPALLLVMVSSLQWLALNRDTDRGFARVRAYLAESPGPEPAERPLVWDFLAARNLKLRRWSDAADAASHAAEYAPHRRILLMWALAETMKGDYRAAERVYLQLLARVPEDPLAWLGLAGVARRLGDQPELGRALEKLRGYAPEGAEMRVIRRHLQYFPEAWPFADGWR